MLPEINYSFMMMMSGALNASSLIVFLSVRTTAILQRLCYCVVLFLCPLDSIFGYTHMAVVVVVVLLHTFSSFLTTQKYNRD